MKHNHIFTILTALLFIAIGNKAFATVLQNPTYRTFEQKTYVLYTTVTNLTDAMNSGWAYHGGGTDGTFTAAKEMKDLINPEGGDNISTTGADVKDGNNKKTVCLYVKGITEFTAYSKTTSGTTARHLKVTINSNGKSETREGTESMDAQELKITGLAPNIEYELILTGMESTKGGDISLYAVKFERANGSEEEVLTKPVITSDIDGNVTITHTDASAKIYYTTDNNVPNASSNEYTGSFKVAETTTVKAIAVKGDKVSEVTTKEVKIVIYIKGYAVCTFNEKKPSNQNDFIFEGFGDTNCPEGITMDGVDIIKTFKVQSGASVTFATKNKALLKILFTDKLNSTASCYSIKIDGKENALEKPGVLYVELEAGEHKLERTKEAVIGYIGVFERYGKLTVGEAGLTSTYYDYPLSFQEGINKYAGEKKDGAEDVLHFTRIDNVLAANVPVLISAEQGEYWFNESDQTGNGKAGIMKGTLEATTVAASSVLVLGANNQTGKPCFGTYLGTTIPAHKAYVDKTDVNGVKMMSIDIDNGETTGIGGITANDEKTADSVYTLNGQRVMRADRPGIYIKNGKKFIVK